MLSSTSLIVPLEIAKFVFFAVYVAATIGVIVGVYLEGDQFDKETQQRGWRLLVGALAVDTLFTVLVFGTDGWISHIQRNEIIALENRLAARSLTSAQVDDIIGRMKQFPGQHFDIVPYWKNPESMGLSNRIYDALLKAGWLYDKPANTEFILGVETGVILLFDKRSEATEKVAKALIEALRTNDISADVDPGVAAATPDPKTAVSATLTITVGIKP